MQTSTNQGLLWLIINRDVKFDKSAIVDRSKKEYKDSQRSQCWWASGAWGWSFVYCCFGLGDWVSSILKGTVDIGLAYDRASIDGSSIVRFVDFDFVGDLDKSRSLTGYVFTLFDCAISWEATL